MSELIGGLVLNMHAYGAMIRLESGEIASAPAADVSAHRATYERAVTGRKTLQFVRQGPGRHPVVRLAPQIRDDALETQIGDYLKSTQEWEVPDAPPAHERHFLQKKRRAERRA
ncbi:MAG TPA: hypothetical protein VIG51_09790 [Candidatus Baltobacteraceae bacterium]